MKSKKGKLGESPVFDSHSMSEPLSAPASLPMSEELQSSLPITVGIVEDEADVRAMFESAVRQHPRLSLAFSAGTAATAIELAQQRPAQVYMVDLGLPDRNGQDVIRWINLQQPQALCMVVTVFGDEEHVVTSLEAGAVGYLLKDTPIDEIPKRVVELYEGGSPISPSVARRVLRRFITSPAQPVTIDNPLSSREHEILKLIEKGMTYEEIASVLEITWHTVTAHLRRVYRKLQVNSRGEAVFEARQRGIL
jgi:DNA-binding NarL/FixJ family response regulator